VTLARVRAAQGLQPTQPVNATQELTATLATRIHEF